MTLCGPLWLVPITLQLHTTQQSGVVVVYFFASLLSPERIVYRMYISYYILSMIVYGRKIQYLESFCRQTDRM